MTESIRDPPNPPAIAAHTASARQPASAARSAMNAAPARDAASPRSVMPPEVPVGTTFMERMLRGFELERAPTSVAHVSAVDAARAAAAAAGDQSECEMSDVMARTANTLPFAKTCAASRPPLLSTTSKSRARLTGPPIRERATALAKKATSRDAQLHPAAVHAVPSTAAAPAPLFERARARYASRAIPAASAIPASVRGGSKFTSGREGSRLAQFCAPLAYDMFLLPDSPHSSSCPAL